MINGLLPDTHTVGEHYDAAMSGAWCKCVPQSAIDVINHWQHAYMRGYNLNEPEDQKRWETDTYGRHDIEFVGFMARRYPVPQMMPDDRVPQDVWIIKNGPWDEILGGKHRCDYEPGCQGRPHMRLYGGWCLWRGDGDKVRAHKMQGSGR